MAAVGYHEPSLVFLTATDIQLLDDGAAAARFLKDHPGGYALVEKRQVGQFLAAAGEIDLRVDRKPSIDGLNYSRGQRVAIPIYRVRPAP